MEYILQLQRNKPFLHLQDGWLFGALSQGFIDYFTVPVFGMPLEGIGGSVRTCQGMSMQTQPGMTLLCLRT